MKYVVYLGLFMLFLIAGFGGLIWMAPSEISFKINEDINAPISEVFDAMSNPQKLTSWVYGMASVKQVGQGELTVGSECELAYEGDGNMVMNQVVTALDKDKRYAYKGTVKDFMEKVSVTEFESLDSMTTRISTHVTLKALGYKMKMLLYAKDTHIKNERENYLRLKKYLEK